MKLKRILKLLLVFLIVTIGVYALYFNKKLVSENDKIEQEIIDNQEQIADDENNVIEDNNEVIDNDEKREALYQKMGQVQEIISNFVNSYLPKDVDAFIQSLDIDNQISEVSSSIKR